MTTTDKPVTESPNVMPGALLSWALFMAMALPVRALQRAIAPMLNPFVAEFLGAVAIVFVACLAAFWFLHKGWFPANRKRLYMIGFIWLILTLAVDLVGGRWASGLDWNSLLANYRLDQGRLYGLSMIALLFVPMGVAQRNEVID